MIVSLKYINLAILVLFIVVSLPFIFLDWFLFSVPIITIKLGLLFLYGCQLIKYGKLNLTMGEKKFFVTLISLLIVKLFVSSDYILDSITDTLTILFFVCFYFISKRDNGLKKILTNMWICLIFLVFISTLLSIITYRLIPQSYSWFEVGGYHTMHNIFGTMHISPFGDRPSWYLAEPSYLGFFLGLNLMYIYKYACGLKSRIKYLVLFLYMLTCCLVGSNTLYVGLLVTVLFVVCTRTFKISFKYYNTLLLFVLFSFLLILPHLDFFQLYYQYEEAATSSLGDRQDRMLSSAVILNDFSALDYLLGRGVGYITTNTGRGESNVYYNLLIEYGFLFIILYFSMLIRFLKSSSFAYIFVVIAFMSTIVHLFPLALTNFFAILFLCEYEKNLISVNA